MIRILACLALLLLIPVSHAANPTQLCPTAKTGDRAPSCSVPVTCGVPTQANDMVRTVVAAVQVWEPYSTLTMGSNVMDCTKGTWSSVGQIGLPLFSSLPVPAPVFDDPPPVTTPPVVTPPPVVVPPAIISVTIKPLEPSDPPQAAVVYSSLPAGACFSLSDGTHTTQACLPQ
jgi:hypothetical protein